MIKILNENKINNKINYQILIFSLNIDQKLKIRSMIFSKIRLRVKKNRIIEKKNEMSSCIRHQKLSFMCCIRQN